MSNKGLSYEIGVDYAKALKEADAFMKNMKKRMEEEFTINIDYRGRGKGSGGRGGGGSSLADDVEKERQQYLKNQERMAARSEKIYNDMLSNIRKAEQRSGRALISERQSTVDKLQELLQRYRDDPDKFRRRASEAVGGYTQQLSYNSKTAAEERRIRDQEERSAQERVKQQFRTSDQMAKIYQDLVSNMSKEEQRLGKALISERQDTMRKLHELLADWSLTPDQVRRKGKEAVQNYSQQIIYSDKNLSEQQKIDAQRLASEQRTGERLYEIRANALHRVEAIETRSGVNLAALRMQTEARINSIVENAGNQRLSDVQRAVQREIVIYQKGAKAIQALQTVAKGSGGISNKSIGAVFQIQQAVEDYSYAGLRGAGNNIALMASALGGPAGLIALLGITAVTLVPVVQSLMDMGDELDIDTARVDALNDSIVDLLKNDWSAWWNSAKAPDDNQLKRFTEDIDKMRNSLNGLEIDAQKMKKVHQVFATLYQNTPALVSLYKKQADGTQGPLAETDRGKFFRQALANAQESLQKLMPERDFSEMLNLDSANFDAEAFKKIAVDIGKELGLNAVEQMKMNRELEKAVEAESRWSKILEERKKKTESASNKLRDQFGIGGAGMITADDIKDSIGGFSALKQAEKEYQANRKMLEEDLQEQLEKQNIAKAESRASHLWHLEKEHKLQLDAADALKKAEKDALDAAKEALRAQEQKNKAIKDEVEQRKESIKQLKEESQQQRLGFAESGFGTLKSMSANRNNWRAEQVKKAMGLHLSPNQDYVNYWGGIVDEYFAKATQYETAFLNKAQDKFLSSQASAAGKSGDYESQRDILGKLQSHQLQMASSATNPYEANMWFAKAQQTQQLIEDSYKKQQDYEAKKIQNLHEQIKSLQDLENKVKNLEVAIEDLPQIDIKDPTLIPWLQEVQNRINALKAMDGGLGGIGGKPVPAMNPFVPQALSLGDPGYQSPFKQVPVEARAGGGPITRGMPYLVGERGPEFIIPNVNGTVLDAAMTKQLMRGRTGSSLTNNSTNLNGPMNVNVTTVGSTLDGVLNEVRQQQANLRMRRGQ